VSLSNIFRSLGRELDFRLVTTDRDIDDDAPYDAARPGQWVPVGHANVLYLSREELSVARLSLVVNEVRPRVLYLNSFFDTWFTGRLLLARRLRRLPDMRFILAPRGEFSPGALGLKTARKRAYIAGLKGAGLLQDIEWHASTPFEAEEILKALGARVARHIHVAPDLGAMPDEEAFGTWRPRKPGRPLRICFISRVSPKKNLLGAIRAAARMRRPVLLTVYGPKEDADYWEECRRAARESPEHISFEDGGSLRPDAVHRTIAAHDVFFLPTLGENYGHVIPEALSVGLPVVISDRTPWRDLAAEGVGYEGPLDEAAFARELDRLAALGPAEMRALRETCRAFARSVLTDPAAVEANRRLFLG
jgi:glycosyltransferase involved in cell wall biosynthesis